MKKAAISGVTVIILSWIITTTQAQFENSVAKLDSTASFARNGFSIPGVVNDLSVVNTKAEMNFTKTYKNAMDIMWYPLNDKRSMVRFFDNGIQTKIFYNRKGSQEDMIRYYTEDKLPNEVRHAVRATYYDFHIFLVIEVTVGNQIAYLVKIDDKTCTKTIRVMNGEMDLIEEMENL